MRALRWREETICVGQQVIPYRWSTDGQRLWVNCLSISDITHATGTEYNNGKVARLVAEGLCRHQNPAAKP